MAIRDDLLYEENILNEKEVSQILNPFDEKILKEYGSDIALSGYTKVVEEYIKKINSFLEYNNCNKFDKHYKEVIQEYKIVRFRKKVNENEYVDCLADSEGAQPYDYILKTKTYVEDEQGKDNVYIEFNNDLPKEFKSFNKCDITELINNFEKIKKLLYNEKVITKKVAINLMNDIIKSIEVAQSETKNWYLEKKFWNKEKQISNLPSIKQQYIEYYNLYEKLKSQQSFYVTKAKYTNGSEIDTGLNI